MSLDAYFGSEAPPAPPEIVAYLRDHPHVAIREEDGVTQALYENPATGVYFIFDVGNPFGDEEEVEITPPVPLVLSLALNFNRPAFFARECAEFVERVCNALDLRFALEPDEPPRAFDREALLSAWEEGNRVAVQVITEQHEAPPFMKREKADEWWRYARRKPELDARFERERYDVFVPSLMLMHDRDTHTVVRTVAWPEAIPIVMPPADAFVVQRKTRKRFLGRTEDGVVDAAAVLDAIGAHLRPLEDEVRILPPEEAASDVVRDAFAALALRPLDHARYEGLAPDGFVDVRADAA